MSVTFEMDGPLAIVTFRTPPMNLLTDESLDGFAEAAQLAVKEKARALLTLAEGPHFCAGADVKTMFHGKDSNDGRRMLAHAFPIIQSFERLPIPTVMAVRGLCLGGGCELLQVHDIVFASNKAGIGQVEVLVATSTLLGGAGRLVSRVGVPRAKEMVFSGKIYDAQTMLEWGLINRVCEDDQVEAKARAYAMQLANGPTVAYKLAKAAINTAASDGVHAADALLMEAAPATYDTHDMREAARLFVEKGAQNAREGLVFTGS